MDYFKPEQTNQPNRLEENNFSEFESRYQGVFDSFTGSLQEVVSSLDQDTVTRFFTKYGLILNSFGEVRVKLIEKIKTNMEKKLVDPDFLENVLSDIEKILNSLLLKVLKDDFGQNYDTRNVFSEHGDILKTSMDGNCEDNQDIRMVFNFLPQKTSEARVAFSKKDEEGELSLRFDLDKNTNKVFCDFQSYNLDVLLGGDHHLLMENLTDFVGAGEDKDSQRENFKRFVETFKEFLQEISESQKSYTLEDLMKKFNQ